MVNYSINQTGATATLLSSAVSSSTLLGIILTGTPPFAETALFTLLTLIFWVLVPIYWLRIRGSYIIGLIFCIVGLIAGIGIVPGVEPIWQVLPGTTFTVSLAIIWIVSLACAYFSYKAYIET